MQHLKRAIFHCGNTEGAHFGSAVPFGDVHSSEGLGAVTGVLQRLDALSFLFRGVPQFTVYPGCPFARIFGHAFNGQGFCAKRMGQEMLQGFDLTPSPFL